MGGCRERGLWYYVNQRLFGGAGDGDGGGGEGDGELGGSRTPSLASKSCGVGS